MREVLGHVISRSTPRKVIFVALKGARVAVGDFCVIEHPWEGVPVFLRVRDVQTINEEIEFGKAGLIASSTGLISNYSSELEYMIAECEVLGYRDPSSGRIKPLEASPTTLTKVMRPDQMEIASFLIPPYSHGLPLTIGRIKGTRVPFTLDLSAVARGHMFVTGMTRSGKSVTGDSVVVIYDSIKGNYFIGPIEDFFKSVAPKDSPEEVLIDLRSFGYETLTLGSGLTPKWSKLAGIYRHAVNKELYEIVTATGRKLRVTEDHSLLVTKDGSSVFVVTPKKLMGMKEIYLVTPRGAPMRFNSKSRHFDRLTGLALASGVALKDGVLIMDPDLADVKLACLEVGVDFRVLKGRGVFVRSPELSKVISQGPSELLNLPVQVEELGVKYHPLAKALREYLMRCAFHEPKSGSSVIICGKNRVMVISTILSLLGVTTLKFFSRGFFVDPLSFRILMDRLEHWNGLENDGASLLRLELWPRTEGILYRTSVNLERIVSVRRVYANVRYVYDLDVPGDQNFLANGVFVHNSSFVSSLIAKASELKPRPRFLVLDRRGEYEKLASKGGVIYDYTSFLPRVTSISPHSVARKLGYRPGTLSYQLLTSAFREADGDPELAMKALRRIAREMRVKDSLLGEIESRLKRELGKLDSVGGLSVVEEVRKNPLVIVDFSSDRKYEEQFFAVKSMVDELSSYAVSRRKEGDFALIVVIEEAQYLVPEKGFSIVGDPYEAGAAQSIIEAVSQAGGYNLGFIIVTQRPAYVSKSVISQANTVVAFRLRNGNDQEAIARYTEVEDVQYYLPMLSDHEALIWGMGSRVPFPVHVEVEVVVLPSKSVNSPERAWERM